MTLITGLFLFVVAVLLLTLILAVKGTGDGADLVDWDPTERLRTRRRADEEDVAWALERHNQERAEASLPPMTEDEFRRGIARRRRFED